MFIIFDNVTAVTDSNTSLFLDLLPAELRNRIYHLVLVIAPYTIKVTRGRNSPFQKALRQIRPQDATQARATPRPALLQTCRQIRREASGIYNTQNTFVVGEWREERSHYADHIRRWLQPLAPWYYPRLQLIYLCVEEYDEYWAAAFVSGILEEIRGVGMYLPPKKIAVGFEDFVVDDYDEIIAQKTSWVLEDESPVRGPRDWTTDAWRNVKWGED
jgi:hypothetical protein